MPSVATMELYDGQATPVAHYFAPQGDQDKNGVMYFYDRSTGVPIGYNCVSFALKQPPTARLGTAQTGNRVYRGSIRVIVPITETPSGATVPQLAGLCSAQVDISLPERSTLQMRKDLQAYLKNTLAYAYTTAMFEDLEGLR